MHSEHSHLYSKVRPGYQKEELQLRIDISQYSAFGLVSNTLANHQWVQEFVTGRNSAESKINKINKSTYILLLLLMASITRLTDRSIPPPDGKIVREATTIKKTRFFDAFDIRSKNESIRSIYKDL